MIDDPSNLPKINDSNRMILRSMIFQKLNEIHTRNAFDEYELNPDSFPKLLTDEDIYSKFETTIATNWMNVEVMASGESGLNGGQLKKKKKQYQTAIHAESNFVKGVIEDFTMQSSSQDKGDLELDENDEQQTVSSLSETQVSSSSQKRKKKKLKKHKKKKHKDKKKSRKSKKRKKDKISEDSSDVDMTDGDVDGESRNTSLVEQGKDAKYQDRKVIFEQEKKQLLKQIPKEVKAMFRSVGFCKWNKAYLPVMILGPYDVAPGNLRDLWMEMKTNSEKNDTEMNALVFWYGFTKEDLSSAFSFMNTKNILTYEEGCKKGYNILPKVIQNKIAKNAKLTKKEINTVRGLKDIDRDAKLSVEDRSPWLFEFDEEYEIDSDDDEDTSVHDNSPKQVTKAKMKKGKRKNDAVDDDEPAKATKKRNQKTKNKTEELEMSPNRKKITKATSHLDDEILEEVAQEEAFFEEQDIPSEDDLADDDFSADDESSDEEDETYEENPTRVSKSMKSAKSTKSKEVKSPKIKQMDKKDNIRQKFKEQQRLFEICENKVLPLMSKLKREDLAIEKAEKYLKKVLEYVNILTPPFIQEYQAGLLIKDLRNRHKNVASFNALCKTITAQMKMNYTEKLPSVPEGFKPKRNPSLSLEPKKKKMIRSIDDQSIQESNTAKEVTLATTPTKNVTNGRERKTEEIANNNKKKSFSLMGLMSQPKQEDKRLEDSSKLNIPPIEKAIVPRWVQNYKSLSSKMLESKIDRELAMNFFNDAVACLPNDKINRESVADALEDALFTKYEGIVDAYWDRVHDICAALAGRKKILAQKIIDGEYATPLDVINLPTKLLRQDISAELGNRTIT